MHFFFSTRNAELSSFVFSLHARLTCYPLNSYTKLTISFTFRSRDFHPNLVHWVGRGVLLLFNDEFFIFFLSLEVFKNLTLIFKNLPISSWVIEFLSSFIPIFSIILNFWPLRHTPWHLQGLHLVGMSQAAHSLPMPAPSLRPTLQSEVRKSNPLPSWLILFFLNSLDRWWRDRRETIAPTI